MDRPAPGDLTPEGTLPSLEPGGFGAVRTSHGRTTGRGVPAGRGDPRPSLTDGQYRQMLEAAASIDWRFEVARVLAHETGHRIGSIRNLRWSDLEVREGWVRWREENEKVEWEHLTPLTPDALSALRRAGSRRTDAEDG